MTPVPLHPALVHLPLGLAFILPILTVGFTWALCSGRIRPRAWLTIVGLEVLLLGAGLVALNTGEHEGDRIESAVPKTALESHEARAEQFLWATGVTLALAAAVLVVRRPAALRTLTAATVLGTLLVAAAAIRVGHAGGQLVYVHNAGAAYAQGNKARTPTGAERISAPLTESRADDDAR